MDLTFTPFEAKFAEGNGAGQFQGYGAIFGHEDSHGDVFVPGAFKDSLDLRRAQGRSLPMYAMHGLRLGADPLPVGVWSSVEEDERGLKVAGEIAAMDTEYGRRIYGLVKSGALAGLSVGYRVARNGASHGAKAGEPKRTLKKVDLFEISLVDDPSNAQSRIDEIKAARPVTPIESFAWRLRDGEPPEIKEFEDVLREAGVPKAMAVQIASVGYAKAIRSESEGKANEPALLALKAAARAFLPPT